MQIHKVYSNLDEKTVAAIDAAYLAVKHMMHQHGIDKMHGGDPAERLVEAIAAFLVESDPTLLKVNNEEK